MLNSYLAAHCGQTYDKIEEDTDRDFFMSAEQAKDYGLVDSVVSIHEAADEDSNKDDD